MPNRRVEITAILQYLYKRSDRPKKHSTPTVLRAGVYTPLPL